MFLGLRKLSHSHTMYRARKYSQFPTNFKIMTLACTAKSYIEHGFMLYWINRWRCSNFVLHEHGKWASQAHAGIHMIWIRNYLYTDCIWCHSVTTYILTAYDVIVSRMLLTVKVMNDGGSFCLWSVLSLLVLQYKQFTDAVQQLWKQQDHVEDIIPKSPTSPSSSEGASLFPTNDK